MGERLRRRAGAAIGEHVDLIEGFDGKNRLQDGDDGEHRHELREGHVLEGLPGGRAIDISGLDGLLGKGGDAADQDEGDERDPAPDVGHDADGEGKRGIGQPGDLGERRKQQAEEGVEEAEFRVEHEAERDADQGRGHGKRKDQERPHRQPEPPARRQQEGDAERDQTVRPTVSTV